MDQEYAPPQSLHPCSTCGRRFNERALSKHAPACAKSQNKPRKVFNSAAQRQIEDAASPQKFGATSGLSTVKSSVRSSVLAGANKRQTVRRVDVHTGPNMSSGSRAINNRTPQNDSAKPDWKKKSEDMRAQMKYAREAAAAAKRGEAPPPPPKLHVDPTADYVTCPYCSRKFNETAGPRHIKFCETQAKKLPSNRNKAENMVSKAKMDKRLNYKPPKLGGLKNKMNSTDGGANSSNFGMSSTSDLGGDYNWQRKTTGSSGFSTGVSSSGYGIQKSSSGYGIKSGASDGQNLNSASRRFGSGRKTGLEKGFSDMSMGDKRVPIPSARSNDKSRLPASSSGSFPRRGGMSKTCGECRTEYPVEWAKFCCMCGKKRA